MMKKILLVDNNTKVRQVLSQKLSEEGYELIESSDGKDAIAKAEKEKPDLIISDIFISKVDGLEFCDYIRSESTIPTVPFIILSSVNDLLLEVRSFRTGADEFLVKPHVKREELLLIIQSFLKKDSDFKRVQSTLHEGFAGKLSDLRLLDIIEIIHNTNKNGILMLLRGTVEGYICFSDGIIIDAKCADLRGEGAIYRLLEWDDGFFKFERDTSSAKKTILTPTDKILQECHQMFSEK